MIPTIDAQHPDLALLTQACEQWGFFYLQGHDLDPQLRAEALQVSLAFFRQPTGEKRKIRRSDTNPWGFYDEELTKNRRDWKEIFDLGPDQHDGPLAGARAQWPTDPQFRSVIAALNDSLHRVSLQVLRHILATLDGDPHLITQAFEQHSSFLRLNYYPVCDNPAPADSGWVPKQGELGISHHTDAGAVTVLMQDDVAGLQVHHASAWHTVEPQTDALIINIGDIVQVWSNDRYRAPLHRVLANSQRERISTPYFLNPAYDFDYAPLTDATPRYRPINWGEFRARRSAGDYADVGAEVQISDYHA